MEKHEFLTLAEALFRVSALKTPTYESHKMNKDVMQRIQQKNAWVIARIYEDGRMDTGYTNPECDTEQKVTAELVKLKDAFPGAIFASFKMDKAIRQQTPKPVWG